MRRRDVLLTPVAAVAAATRPARAATGIKTLRARFELPAYDRLFQQQRVLPDTREGLAVLREAGRLMTAYMPYLLHMNRISVDLCRAWVVGYRSHPFSSRNWLWVDLDPALRFARES